MNKDSILRDDTYSKKMEFVTYLKAIACILITNSHCRQIYPLYFLAVGGGHGNAIFFVLSGFCLALISQPFVKWIKRRYERIIPSLLLMILVFIIILGFNKLFALGIIKSIIILINQYWFAFAILIFYPVFYLIFNKKDLLKIKIALILYVALYLLIYFFVIDTSKFNIEKEGFSPIKVFFYFGIFISGGLIRLNINFIRKMKNPFVIRKVFLVLVIISGLIWGITYGLIMIFKCGYSLQILIHLSIFVFSISIINLAIIQEVVIGMLPKISPMLKKILLLISDSTFEIYIVQVTFLKAIEKIGFPKNFLLFIMVAFIGGISLNKGISKVKKLLIIEKIK